MKKYRLLTPGPVPLPPSILKILGAPMWHHRTPQFEKVLRSVHEKLKLTFQTKNPVLILTSTGSGAMEAAIVNTLSPGDEIITVVSGKFGERWSAMAGEFGIKSHDIKVPWGESVDPLSIRDLLIKNPRIRAVLCQVSETSTATVHPIKEIAEIVREHSETLFMVDAITAIGAMDLQMDSWGLDVVVSGSQKAFMLPTGVSFIALSDKAWAANKTSKCPKFYFNLQNELKTQSRGETYFSSSVPHIRALDLSLKQLTGLNLKKSIKRCHKLAEVTRKASEMLGLCVYSKSPSSSVTAIALPSQIDGQKLRDELEKKYHLVLMGGQDQLKGKILRIGHLGYITNEDMLAFFDGLCRSLIKMGHVGANKKVNLAIRKYLLRELR